MLSLNSCGWTLRPQVITKPEYIELTCLNAPRTSSLQLKETPAQAIVSQDKAYIAFDAQSYRNLAENLSAILEVYTTETQKTKHYKKCIDDFNIRIRELKKQLEK